VVENEEEFEAATRLGGIANIVFDSERAPRILILDQLYWPPTEKAAAVLQERIDTLMATGTPDWDVLKEIAFEELEGVDISAIWGKTWSGHPSSRGEDWPVRFPPGRPLTARAAPALRRINPKKKRRHSNGLVRPADAADNQPDPGVGRN
jgi:hypothetical protein